MQETEEEIVFLAILIHSHAFVQNAAKQVRKNASSVLVLTCRDTITH